MAEFIASIDQGTTSTRCMIFDHDGAEVGCHQLEHEQILPRAGWVEHNPVEIWERTASALMSVLNATNLAPKDIAALGITNQRETTLVRNRHTGYATDDRAIPPMIATMQSMRTMLLFFDNSDFKRAMNLLLSPDGKAVRMIISHRAIPRRPEGISRMNVRHDPTAIRRHFHPTNRCVTLHLESAFRSDNESWKISLSLAGQALSLTQHRVTQSFVKNSG